ncbi:hypothetical protein [Thermomonas sp. HDW16]|uniref:tetratricopeptide repeat protein n=1 Tax=Thermomonas sp. HDW16 TaxID=2714945 RepID=UPI001409BF04|nr:hypothetical protein [Thermomonas sp. HDW16]QIL20502.1 hypothetical protein G7079_07025 [Thermomonas sp. HDW16]
MNRIARIAVLAGVVMLALILACTILAIIRSDAALDRGDPAAALRARPDNPETLMRLADGRLAADDIAQAEVLAKQLLSASPADGRGYRSLAQVAESRGQQDRAAKLYVIAAKRAPGDLQARAWLAEHALAAGDYSLALEHIDRVLSISAGSHARLFPVLVKLAGDPAFADALAQVMSLHPQWRDALLATLLDPGSGNQQAADLVMAGLQRRQDLDASSLQAWIEALMRQGRWGAAFAHWAGPHVASGRTLPLLFNGDFASAPQGSGFDWRWPPKPGVMISIEPDGAAGMLHVQFLGRRVAGGALASHALLLAPGNYRLTWLERMDAMRASTGVAWQIRCEGQSTPRAESESSLGTRPWHARQLVFTVPAIGCTGQWLHLAGSGDAAAGQILSGDVWYGSMKVTSLVEN